MIDFLIGICILLVIVLLFYFLINFAGEIDKQKARRKSNGNRKNTIFFQAISPTKKSISKIHIHNLESQLLKLLGGQKDTANRLVNNMRLRNPEKDAIWCLEKVIQDLERDRR